MRDVAPFWQNWIGGDWVDGGAGRIGVTDPGTGEPLAEQALADAADVDRAVAAARVCHESGALSDLRPVERGRMGQAMGRYLLDNLGEIARLLTLEQG
jgi:aldehyde dehydrogenase (NAD+)